MHVAPRIDGLLVCFYLFCLCLSVPICFLVYSICFLSVYLFFSFYLFYIFLSVYLLTSVSISDGRILLWFDDFQDFLKITAPLFTPLAYSRKRRKVGWFISKTCYSHCAGLHWCGYDMGTFKGLMITSCFCEATIFTSPRYDAKI